MTVPSMDASSPAPEEDDLAQNIRWSRTEESDGYFHHEDLLRAHFRILLAVGALLICLLATGLWRLRRASLAPPDIWGVAGGILFKGTPGTKADVSDADFDRQLSDTVEVLFGRTEKGLPSEIADFCAPEVVAAIGKPYQDIRTRYPAGYVQSLALQESKTIAAAPGFREVYYRGLLTSRSLTAAQVSPIYLDCVFEIRKPTGINATGWRLMRATALTREAYYRRERERAVRQLLELPAPPPHG
jgi:hypothetical protein